MKADVINKQTHCTKTHIQRGYFKCQIKKIYENGWTGTKLFKRLHYYIS